MADKKEKRLIRFAKRGTLKFIGHLDFLRVFQQTIRRAGIPVAYSQGFNPHPLLSFALPLPVGMESASDYLEITLDFPMEEEEICTRLNQNAPKGLTVTGVKQIRPDYRVASLTAAADYAVYFKDNSAGWEALPLLNNGAVLQGLLSEPTVLIRKKTKSGEKEADIRPDIFDLRLDSQPDVAPKDGAYRPILMMRLAAGSARFLNPLSVIGLLLERMGLEAAKSIPVITRLELFRYDGDFHSLYEA